MIGELAEWSNAAVLKTVEGHTSGGSNPSLSATLNKVDSKTSIFNEIEVFFVQNIQICSFVSEKVETV